MPIEFASSQPDKNPPRDGPGGFEADATATLRELRRATASLLASCNGIDRAIEVSTRLGLERSLAWKVWKVAQGTSAYPSVAHIPGKQGFRRLLSAARRTGVSEDLVASAAAAYEQFERLAVAYAGDRVSAESLLGSLSAEGRKRHETSLRRDAFRANASFLGVQVAAMYQLDVLLPGERGLMPELVRVRGHFGLRRNRPNVPWILSRSTLVHAEGPSAELRRVPLVAAEPRPDEELEHAPLPMIVAAFSSTPLPPVRRRLIAGVTVEDELLPGAVGQSAAVDVVTGERITPLAKRWTSSDAVTMAVNTPCENLCYEIVAPDGLFHDSPLLRVHSTVQVEHPYLRGPDFGVIPVIEGFSDLGAAEQAPPAAEVPRHSDLIRWTLAQCGWNSGAMRLWRVRMRFPPLPSCLAASYRQVNDASPGSRAEASVPR